MNALTQASEETLAPVVEAFGLGTQVHAWPAAYGIENTNYFLTTRAGPGAPERTQVVTFLNQRSYAGAAYADIIDSAEDAGLPVPALLRTPEGKASINLGGQQIRVSRCLPGAHVFNASNSQVAALGRTLARLHLATARLTERVAPYPRDIRWLEQRATGLRARVAFTTRTLMDDAVVMVGSLLSRSDVKHLPRGVIHGDLFRDNVLFDERGLTGLLDFHHAAAGFWIFDLAVVANDWCTDSSGVLNTEHTRELLMSYARVRPLVREELWFFPLFCQYAALAFLLSRLSVVLEPPTPNARFKNPGEFERILRQHQAHSLYLDERYFQGL